MFLCLVVKCLVIKVDIGFYCNRKRFKNASYISTERTRRIYPPHISLQGCGVLVYLKWNRLCSITSLFHWGFVHDTCQSLADFSDQLTGGGASTVRRRSLCTRAHSYMPYNLFICRIRHLFLSLHSVVF